MPEVWVSRSRTVTSRLAGTVVQVESSSLNFFITLTWLNSGMYLDTGSSRRNFPSSINIITAQLVKALLWVAIRKIATCEKPTDFLYTTFPFLSDRKSGGKGKSLSVH